MKKELCKIFQSHGLKITIEANVKVTNFLEVTLNLNTHQHQPYLKPNSTTSYVHRKSNHPPAVLYDIPDSINKRLSNISSNAEVFNNAKQQYQKALDDSGYKHLLTYTTNQEAKA